MILPKLLLNELHDVYLICFLNSLLLNLLHPNQVCFIMSIIYYIACSEVFLLLILKLYRVLLINIQILLYKSRRFIQFHCNLIYLIVISIKYVLVNFLCHVVFSDEVLSLDSHRLFSLIFRIVVLFLLMETTKLATHVIRNIFVGLPTNVLFTQILVNCPKKLPVFGLSE